MSDIKYGEIKTRKNIFPKDARELVEKDAVGILISQCSVSSKTKDILSNGNITLYENVEADEVEKIREIVAEKLKEKLETEEESHLC